MAAGAWEAVAEVPGGAGSDLYSVNLLDGTVLLNGAPPGRLPRTITAHPLFVRTFGPDTNFEVAARAGGALETSSRVRGRFYRFQLLAGARLLVTELDPEHGVELELLECGGAGVEDEGGWAAQLPVRLAELHSHWLSRKRGVLVLRPPGFLDRSCDFVGRLSWPDGGGSSGAALLDVRRVPADLRGRHWTALASHAAAGSPGPAGPGLWADLPDRLVLALGGSKEGVLRALAKFEDARYIHVHAPSGQGGRNDLAGGCVGSGYAEGCVCMRGACAEGCVCGGLRTQREGRAQGRANAGAGMDAQAVSGGGGRSGGRAEWASSVVGGQAGWQAGEALAS